MQTSWVDLPHWTLSCLLLSLESGVDCPCPWFHANSLCSPLCCSAANCPLLGRVVNCPRRGPPSTASLASPSHFRIRRDFMSKNPLSGFAPKQTIESSALAAQPHSATALYGFPTKAGDWFLCLFWRETRQRILGPEISPNPEVVRGREWELTTRPSRGQLATGR